MGTAARARDGAARPHSHARVRRRRDHRSGRQPALAAPDRRRFERRKRGGAGRADDAGRARQRHLRLLADPVGVLRDLRDQADPRAGPARRNRPAGADARPPRADGADDRRLRGIARRDGRRRRSGHAADAATGPARRPARHRAFGRTTAGRHDDRAHRPDARDHDRARGRTRARGGGAHLRATRRARSSNCRRRGRSDGTTSAPYC